MSNSNLFESIIESLIATAVVPVVVDGTLTTNTATISISRMKIMQILSAYPFVYKLVNKCWSNFPEPPCCERVYVFVWAMACDNYCLNHSTIAWEKSTPNTFVHMWSVIDRMKYSFERQGIGWIVGTRSCADFCRSMMMSGPLDAIMYEPEFITPPEITKLEEDFVPITLKQESGSFSSFYDFTMAVRMNTDDVAVSVSDVEAMNNAFSSRSRPGASS